LCSYEQLGPLHGLSLRTHKQNTERQTHPCTRPDVNRRIQSSNGPQR